MPTTASVWPTARLRTIDWPGPSRNRGPGRLTCRSRGKVGRLVCARDRRYVNWTALHRTLPRSGNFPGAHATSMSLAGSTNTSITAGGSYGRLVGLLSPSAGYSSGVMALAGCGRYAVQGARGRGAGREGGNPWIACVISHWYWSFKNGLPVARRARAGQLLQPPRREHPLHDASAGNGCVTQAPISDQSWSQGVSRIGNEGSRSITQ